MKLALIIIGELRDTANTIDKNRTFFKDVDIFVGGYKRDHKYYKSLEGNKNLCLSSMSFINKNIPDKIGINHYKRSMLQWHHLDNVIKVYENELLEYDVILKIRTDTVIKSDIQFIKQKLKTIMKDNTLFYHSDKIFFSNPHIFINVFKNYYSSLTSNYSISEKELFKYFKKIKNINFIFSKIKRDLRIEPLVRGDFVKIIGQGNDNVFIKKDI